MLREGDGAAPHQPCLDRNEVIITALTVSLATEFRLYTLPALAEMKSQPQTAEKWVQEGFKLQPPNLVAAVSALSGHHCRHYCCVAGYTASCALCVTS